jgi:uncharacterized protein YcbK (DUF882 family)
MVHEFMAFYRWLLPRLNDLLRAFPEAVATSWYRDSLGNRGVGGATYSQHLLAFAADFSMPRGQMRAFTVAATELGMVAIDEGDHVHVQMYPAGVIPKSFYLHTHV